MRVIIARFCQRRCFRRFWGGVRSSQTPFSLPILLLGFLTVHLQAHLRKLQLLPLTLFQLRLDV